MPTGEAGDSLVEAIRDLVEQAEGQVLLNRRIFDAYQEISERLINRGGAVVAARTATATATGGFLAAPTLLTTKATHMTDELTEECFGPLIVVARYENLEELDDAFRQLPNSLTATVHVEDDEPELLTELTDRLAPRTGRIVYNGFPTGVRVSWAQHHGGPWPATNSFARTSVWRDRSAARPRRERHPSRAARRRERAVRSTRVARTAGSAHSRPSRVTAISAWPRACETAIFDGVGG